jgi:beta-lactamase regulating signal transducer with metallopeptidase domain
MAEVTHFLTAFSAAAAGSLAGAIWEGTILAVAVALCLHFVKGITAGIRSVLWTAVLLLVIALHFIPLTSSGSAIAQANSALHFDPRWSLAIAAIWLALSIFRAAQLIHSALGLRRIAKQATAVAASPECASLLRAGLRSAELCTSVDVDRPSVIGFFRPRVLIPQMFFEKLSAPELEQIVLHEMEHLRRADDWTNLIQKISLVLFPLNPVLLWVERRLCVERELACDDRVLRVTNAKKAYATCLVNLAEHSVLRRGAMLVLGAWERQSELTRRVRRILRQPEGMMGHRQLRLVTGALMAGIIGGAITLAREPRLISFAPQTVQRAEVEVVPASSSYVPAAFHEEANAPHAVDAIFHELQTPSAKAPVSTGANGTVKPASAKKSRLRRRVNPALRAATDQPSMPASLSRIGLPGVDMTRISTPALPQQRSAWLVLTDWTDAPIPSNSDPSHQLPPALTSTHLGVVLSDGVYSYAAVPVSNGWLIVQL